MRASVQWGTRSVCGLDGGRLRGVRGPGSFPGRRTRQRSGDTGHFGGIPDVAGARQFWKGEEAGVILTAMAAETSPRLSPSPPESSHSSGAGQLSSGITGDRGPDQCGCWGALCSLPPPSPLSHVPLDETEGLALELL